MLNQNLKLAEEIDKLVAIMDEDIDLFCQRVEFLFKGERGKAKFIDEKILPAINERLKTQLERTIEQGKVTFPRNGGDNDNK